MKNVPENELFSAYLDGELTADEQARVEQLLATSAEARQLLESLKALSATLQSLPVHKLDEDLSQRVLRLAERRMLSESPAAPGGADGHTRPESGPSTLPAPHDSLAPEDLRWHFSLRRLLRPRNLVFPAAAVAIALLIAVTERFGENRPAGRPVAMAPSAASREAELATDGDKGPAEQPVMGPMKREVRSEAANVATVAPISNRGAVEVVAAEEKPVGQPLSSSSAITNVPLNAAPPVAGKAPAPAAASAEEESVARRSNLPVVGREMKRAAATPAAATPAAATPEENAPQLKDATPGALASVASVPALVVRCNVTDSNAARGLLEQLFHKQQVSLKGSDDRLQVAMGGSVRKGSTEVQHFVVEISPSQLQKALGELKTHSHLFASYSLEPQAAAPAPVYMKSGPVNLQKKQDAFGFGPPVAAGKSPALPSDSEEAPTRSRSAALQSGRQGEQTSSGASRSMQERLSRGTPEAPIPSQMAQQVTPSQQMPETTPPTRVGQTVNLPQLAGQAGPRDRGSRAGGVQSDEKVDKAFPRREQAAKETQRSLAMQIAPEQVKQRVVFVFRVTAPEANRLAGPEKARAAKKAEAAAKVAEPAKPAATATPAAAAPAPPPSPK